MDFYMNLKSDEGYTREKIIQFMIEDGVRKEYYDIFELDSISHIPRTPESETELNRMNEKLDQFYQMKRSASKVEEDIDISTDDDIEPLDYIDEPAVHIDYT
eukprot:UN01453